MSFLFFPITVKIQPSEIDKMKSSQLTGCYTNIAWFNNREDLANSTDMNITNVTLCSCRT